MGNYYECVKGFTLGVVDGDGFSVENKYITVPAGSVWELSDMKSTITGAEFHFDCFSHPDLGWIEICQKHLDSDFVKLTIPDVPGFG